MTLASKREFQAIEAMLCCYPRTTLNATQYREVIERIRKDANAAPPLPPVR
jgi:hypothetical protein